MVVSEPFILGRELSNWEELTVSSAFFAASSARLLIGICVEVVVMNMLRGVLTMSCVCNCIESTVRDIVPSSL